MKIKYFLLYILITITLIVCGCDKANNNNSNTKSNISNDFKFEKLPDMPTPRAKHTAITMKNGKVLIVGNYPYLDIMPEYKDYSLYADIYNPITKTFDRIKSPLSFGMNPILLNLPDDRVLIVDSPNHRGEKIELRTFDFKTSKMNLIKDVNPISKNALLLKNGNILFSNGVIIEVYDLNNWKLLKTAKLTKPEGYFQDFLLSNGKVLFFCGKDVELYNPKTNKVELVGKRKTSGNGLLLNNDNILILGGSPFTNNKASESKKKMKHLSNLIEIYDTTTNQSNIVGETINDIGSNSNFKSIALKDGRVLIYGGTYNIPEDASIFNDYCTTPLNDKRRLYPKIEVYNPKTNTSSLIISNSNLLRKDHQLTLLQDGNILLTGGFDACPCLSSSDVLATDSTELIIVKKNK